MKPTYLQQHGNLCVLSVDDDQVNLMVMETLLQPQGWKVVTAIDGDDAYAALEEDTWPDIVFLDYNLEVGDSGVTVLKKLKATFGNADIPIVMCTAMSAASNELSHCRELGAADVLLKPYDRDKMVQLVERLLGSKMSLIKNAGAGAPAAGLPPVASASVASSGPSVQDLCRQLDMEYVGTKLEEAGVTIANLKGMDDTALRKAGVVVKGQRDKLLAAVADL